MKLRLALYSFLTCSLICGCVYQDLTDSFSHRFSKVTGIAYPLPVMVGPPGISEYHFHDLGPGTPKSISSYLVVVGERNGKAIYWRFNPKGMNFESSILLSDRASDQSIVNDVNDNGIAVGWITRRDQTIAVLWDLNKPDNLGIELGLDKGSNRSISSQALAISREGLVVGEFDDQSSLWQQSGGTGKQGTWTHRSIKTGKGAATDIIQYRPSARIVGFSDSSGAYILNEGRTSLWFMASVQKKSWIPHGVNAIGLVVGASPGTKGKAYYAALPRGNLSDKNLASGVKTLRSISSVGKTAAYGVNRFGQVVGESAGQAVVWSNVKYVPESLNFLAPDGWELLRANSINSLGVIVGEGRKGDEKRAFLLSPFVFKRAQ